MYNDLINKEVIVLLSARTENMFGKSTSSYIQSIDEIILNKNYLFIYYSKKIWYNY